LNVAAEWAAEKVVYFVIPSGARNLSSIQAQEKKERFLAPLGMTKRMGHFFRSLFKQRVAPAVRLEPTAFLENAQVIDNTKYLNRQNQ
jgi:hypothetical protein